MNGPVAQPGRAAEAFAAEAFKPTRQKSSDKMKTPVGRGFESRQAHSNKRIQQI